jgi:threonine dehydratase
MASHRTIAAQLLQQLHAPNLIFASIWRGRLMLGILSATPQFLPAMRGVPSESEGADLIFQNLGAGRIVDTNGACQSTGDN